MFLPFSLQCQQPVDYIFFHWVKLVSVWSVSTRPHSLEINGPLKGSACLVSDLHFLKVSFFTRTVDFFTRVIVWEFLTSLLMGCLLVVYILQRVSTLSRDRCDKYEVTFLSLKWKTPPLQHYSDNTGRNSKPLTEISSSLDLILRYESALPPAVRRHIHFRHQKSYIHMVWYGFQSPHGIVGFLIGK